MKKKGISSLTLAVTIFIILILVSSISVSITYSINNAKKMTFAKEIYNIQSIVTEYIQKENVLPADTAVQVKISELDQIDPKEDIRDDKLVLNILDLAGLDIKNTTYGNGVLGEEDVYAVSPNTGKVYYIAGFEIDNKKYYTLTEELLNMIEKKQDLNIGESTILFIPNILGWTNQGVSVRVNVPTGYTIDSVTTNNANIICKTESVDGEEYWVANQDKVAQSYTITVSYTKDGTSGTISYTTKFDNVAPVISKDPKIVNTLKSIKGLNATDEESGIKHFKYVEGIIENDYNTATYMNEFGKKIKNGSLKSKKRAIYTLYAEDKAGNYRLIHVDSEGTPAYFTIENSTATNKFEIDKCYELSLLNYRIYGNSVQNGTPTVDSPIEVESVGDKTVNLFSYKTLLEKGYIEIVDEETGEFNWINVSDIPETDIEAKENTQYFVSADVMAGAEQTIQILIYYTDGTYTSISSVCSTENFTHISGVTAQNKTVDYIKFVGAGGLVKGAVFKNLQIAEGTNEKEYEPYGKYKIPITVTGRNLFDINNIVYCLKPTTNTVLDNTLKIVTKTDSAWQGSAITLPDDFTGKTISFSFDYNISNISSNTGYARIGYQNASNNSVIALDGYLIKITGTGHQEATITFPDTMPEVARCWMIYFNSSVGTGATGDYIEVSNLQIEEGDKVTAYEPYMKTTTDIYLDEPLRKIGNYVDYIDFSDGKLVRNTAKREFDGSENWYECLEYIALASWDDGKTPIHPYSVIQGYKSNIAKENVESALQVNQFCTHNMQNVDWIEFYLEMTMDEWKAYLDKKYKEKNPAYVVYALAKPEETSIDLPEIVTKAGYNKITIDTKIAPSKTNIRYYNIVQ